jgi:hypothetical protein
VAIYYTAGDQENQGFSGTIPRNSNPILIFAFRNEARSQLALCDNKYRSNLDLLDKGVAMNRHLNNLLLHVSKIDRQHIQLLFLLLSLGLLVIGAGAPIGGGDGSPGGGG